MDQINNLQAGSAKHLPRPSSPSKVQSNNDDSDKAELSFEANYMVAKLHEMPEIRVEAVDNEDFMKRNNELILMMPTTPRTRLSPDSCPKFNFAADCLTSLN